MDGGLLPCLSDLIRAACLMKAEKFIDFLEHLVLEASGKIVVFADRHLAHEASFLINSSNSFRP
jgi:hypothetical protein